jgi:hypothetical protein
LNQSDRLDGCVLNMKIFARSNEGLSPASGAERDGACPNGNVVGYGRDRPIARTENPPVVICKGLDLDTWFARHFEAAGWREAEGIEKARAGLGGV